MKKILYIIPVIAALASCSKINVAKPGIENNAISFTTLNDKLTRAANSNGDNYKVFAKSTVAGESDWYINADFNGKGADIDKPTSGADYFWPASPNTVSFYAYAPSNAAVTPNYATGVIEVMFNSATAMGQKDFTVATPITARTSAGGNVAFQFSHVLAKISINAKLSDALIKGGYNMSFTTVDLSVERIMATYTVNTDPIGFTPHWPSPPGYTKFTGSTSYMIIPESAVQLQVHGVTITKSGATIINNQSMKKFNINSSDIPNNKFEMGKHYNLTLTINSISKDDSNNNILGNDILFGSALAADWGTSGGDVYPPHPAPGLLTLSPDGTLSVDDPNGTLLMVKHGSILGISASTADMQPWSADRVVFNPLNPSSPAVANYSDIIDLDGYVLAGGTADADVTLPAYHNAANVANGFGDICQLVGLKASEVAAKAADASLDAYKSEWKMPSTQEHLQFVGINSNYVENSTYWTTTSSSPFGSVGGYFPLGQESLKENFLPVIGCLEADGTSGSFAQFGVYYSSTGDSLYLDPTMCGWGNDNIFAAPVRCAKKIK